MPDATKKINNKKIIRIKITNTKVLVKNKKRITKKIKQSKINRGQWYRTLDRCCS